MSAKSPRSNATDRPVYGHKDSVIFEKDHGEGNPKTYYRITYDAENRKFEIIEVDVDDEKIDDTASLTAEMSLLDDLPSGKRDVYLKETRVCVIVDEVNVTYYSMVLRSPAYPERVYDNED